jgi:hypothetical protein
MEDIGSGGAAMRLLQRSPNLFTFLVTSFILFIAFGLKVWDVWIWDGVKGNLIEALEYVSIGDANFFEFHGADLVRLGVLAAFSAGGARLLHCLIWERHPPEIDQD